MRGTNFTGKHLHRKLLTDWEISVKYSRYSVFGIKHCTRWMKVHVQSVKGVCVEETTFPDRREVNVHVQSLPGNVKRILLFGGHIYGT